MPDTTTVFSVSIPSSSTARIIACVTIPWPQPGHQIWGILFTLKYFSRGRDVYKRQHLNHYTPLFTALHLHSPYTSLFPARSLVFWKNILKNRLRVPGRIDAGDINCRCFKSSGNFVKEVFRNHVLQSKHVLPPEH